MWKVSIQGLPVIWRLVRTCQGSWGYRLKQGIAYYPVFVRFQHQQNLQRQIELEKWQKKGENQSYGVRQSFAELLDDSKQQVNRLLSRGRSLHAQKMHDSGYQKQARGILTKGMEYLALYYQSLQELVEGRREVLHSDDFTFEDGQTVKQKKQAFEKQIQRMVKTTVKQSPKQ